MVDSLGLATPLVTGVIAFLFLSLALIGRNVEAPFENDIHDTPMTALSATPGSSCSRSCRSPAGWA